MKKIRSFKINPVWPEGFFARGTGGESGMVVAARTFGSTSTHSLLRSTLVDDINIQLENVQNIIY